MSDVTPDDRDLAIRTMLGEEGSEEGQAGVAAVILNRLAAGSYGASVGDVVLAPHQFEAWTRQSDRLLGIRRNDPRYVAAGQLFDAVRDGSLPDPTNGATHFYAPAAQAALGRQAPGWSQGQGLRLGSSMFYAPQGRVERKPEAPQTYMDFAAGLKRLDAQSQPVAPQPVAPQTVAPQIPNRPPAFLKEAKPVAPPQIPNRPPAFLKDAQLVASAPAKVEEAVGEFSDPITAEAYRKAHEPLHDRRYPSPSPLPGAFMGPAEGPLAGFALDPSLPPGVRGLAVIGQEGLNVANAPFEMTQQQAQRIRSGSPLTPQDAGSVALNAGMLGMREAPGGVAAPRGTIPDAGAARPEPQTPLLLPPPDGLTKPLPGPGYRGLSADKAAGVKYQMPDGTLKGATQFHDNFFTPLSQRSPLPTKPVESPNDVLRQLEKLLGIEPRAKLAPSTLEEAYRTPEAKQAFKNQKQADVANLEHGISSRHPAAGMSPENMAAHGYVQTGYYTDPSPIKEATEGMKGGNWVYTINGEPTTKNIFDAVPSELKSIQYYKTIAKKDATVTELAPKIAAARAKKQSELDRWYDSIARDSGHPSGLPMDEASRIERAKSMGFDTNLTLYHGTGNPDFIKFKIPNTSEPAIFLTDNSKIAESYSHKSGDAPSIIPIWTRMENPKTIDLGGEQYDSYKMSELLNQAKAEGHDAVIIKNILDQGSNLPQTQYAFFEPSNLRAKYGAAFDPAVPKAKMNLMSSVAPPLALLPLIAAGGERRRHPRSPLEGPDRSLPF